METIVYAVMVFSVIILVWGITCLIYSTRLIKAEEISLKGEDTTVHEQ